MDYWLQVGGGLVCLVDSLFCVEMLGTYSVAALAYPSHIYPPPWILHLHGSGDQKLGRRRLASRRIAALGKRTVRR